MIQFKKAVKNVAKLRLAITGPSGSGKTFSALQIASGFGGKIAVIDTENHSASLYADDFSFDTITIDPPYTMDKYVDAINAAVAAKYDVLVIDSISHAWAGEGGLLEKKNAIDARGGNSYVNWAPITKEHEQFKGLLLTCDVHLLVTMRSKQDYIIEQTDKGKSAPRKVGLAPIQRDGMEYEFTMVLDMGMDHKASVSKTRIRSFDGKIFQPNKETGEALLKWLNTGVVLEDPVTFNDAQLILSITEMLSKMNSGDADLMERQLKDLTTHKDERTKVDTWYQLKDLAMVAKTKPLWLVAIHKKVKAEHERVINAEGIAK